MYSMNVYSQQQMQQQGQSQVLLLIFRLARYGPAFFVDI